MNREIIQQKAKTIREKLQGAKLFGLEINLEDPEEVMVAAYFMGEAVGMDAMKKDYSERLVK